MKQIQLEAMTTFEIIKPSSPTPHHLRLHKLSMFDQLEASKYMNTIVYFMSNPSKTRSHISNTLKTSLAQILNIYYPLAGRISDDNLHIDCHDQGAHYREANVKGSLTNEIMSDLDPSELSKFILYDNDVNEAGGLALLVVQVNFFECGGLVIGLRMYHKAGDALSLYTFLTNWASVARNDGDNGRFIVPEFGATAKLFPSVDLNGLKSMDNYGIIKHEDRVLRRFVFSNDTILGLCEKYTTPQEEEQLLERKRPSRVEALTAFIWKRYVASTQTVTHEKNYKVAVAVNLRSRVVPPFLPSVFGNLADAVVVVDKNPNESDHGELVKSIRASIKSLSDPENTKLYQNWAQLHPMLKETFEWMNDSEKEVWIMFTSVCRLYEAKDADFGWGVPSDINVYVPIMFGKNMVAFMDSVDGNGIQAWVSFSKEDMAKFEVDDELLAHAVAIPRC